MSTALALRRSLFFRTQFSLKFARRLHYYAISVPPFRSVLQSNLLARHFPIPVLAESKIIIRTQSTIADLKYTASDLDINEYHKISDKTMERMVEYFEALGDEMDVTGFDVEYAGVLTLKLGSGEIYLLNKQPPNKQIWLSSPISGPKRYDYDAKHGKWFYHRDQSTIDELLDTELSQILVKEVKILKS